MSILRRLEERLERDWTHCRGGTNKPLTPKIVPFALAQESVRNGLIGLVERREFARGTYAILGLIFVLAAGLAASALTLSSYSSLAALLAAANLCAVGGLGFCLWIALGHHHSRRRELTHGSKSDTVILSTISPDGRVYAEVRAPLADCATRVHRVNLGNSRGTLWSGWAVIARVQESNFVLACFRQQAEAEDYVLKMPEWLKRVYKGEGAALAGRAANVRIGN